MVNTRRMLVTAVETLDEEKVIRLVKMGLNKGISPLDLIEDVHQGMKRVGVLYERENYYIADLIMASLIFQRVLTLIPITKESASEQKPQVIIGTVKHDIHDIGKNIIKGLLRSRGSESSIWGLMFLQMFSLMLYRKQGQKFSAFLGY